MVVENNAESDDEGDNSDEDGSEDRGRSLVSGSTGLCVTVVWLSSRGMAFEMNEKLKQRHGGDFAVVLLNEAGETVDFDLFVTLPRVLRQGHQWSPLHPNNGRLGCGA